MMKLKVKEQIVCWIFAVILFVTGMCVEFPPADLYFSYAQEASGDRVSVIRENLKTTEVERICTPNMLKKDEGTYLSNSGRTVIKWFIRNVAILYAVVLFLCCVSYSGKATELACPKLVSSRAAIVRYIQQKDGKK